MGFILPPGLLKRDREKERKKWERGLRCSADRLAFKERRGPSEGQREPASTERRSTGTRELQNRVKSCSYTDVRSNASLCLSKGGQSREHVKASGSPWASSALSSFLTTPLKRVVVLRPGCGSCGPVAALQAQLDVAELFNNTPPTWSISMSLGKAPGHSMATLTRSAGGGMAGGDGGWVVRVSGLTPLSLLLGGAHPQLQE
ncbi:hypothetical protein EYF80_004032 [Liparis tanakae]|uniref:Uncharacterized protein n=1 Tax=Liparis tanakae TaxID=230148 RepID=A0A4Z2J5X5_9TELE|nr:hypothetical protein EYF80_004032 [Liparis tanakae]